MLSGPDRKQRLRRHPLGLKLCGTLPIIADMPECAAWQDMDHESAQFVTAAIRVCPDRSSIYTSCKRVYIPRFGPVYPRSFTAVLKAYEHPARGLLFFALVVSSRSGAAVAVVGGPGCPEQIRRHALTRQFDELPALFPLFRFSAQEARRPAR